MGTPGRKELEGSLLPTELFYADRVLAIDHDVARLWRSPTAKATEKGQPLHAADGPIAATAFRHGLHLMTRNVADFEATGVTIFNPWED